MKKRKCKILTLLFGCVLLASCVSDFDVDRYLIEKENSLIELKKEDAAIRADLMKQIIEVRADMVPKIAEVKDRLSAKVDANGGLVISALMDSVAATGTRITNRVAKTKDYVDEQMTTTKGGIETVFDNLGTKRQALNTLLQEAIAQSNDDQAVEINKRLDAIDKLETMANTVKTKVEKLESNLELSEDLSQQMNEYEERRNSLNTVFNSFNTKVTNLFDLLEQDVDEKIESLKTEQILELKSNLGAAEEFIDEIRDKFSEIDGLTDYAEDCLAQMKDLEDMYNDMVGQAEGDLIDAEDYTNEMEDIIDLADDLDSDVEVFLNILAELDDLVGDYESGDDPSGIWDDFDSIQSNILDLFQETYHFDSLVSELDAQADAAYDAFNEIYTSDAWK